MDQSTDLPAIHLIINKMNVVVVIVVNFVPSLLVYRIQITNVVNVLFLATVEMVIVIAEHKDMLLVPNVNKMQQILQILIQQLVLKNTVPSVMLLI